MAATSRHHLIPQFLLRRFADADRKLVQVRRDALDLPLLTSVKNACNEAGFYRLEAEDLEPDHRAGHDPESIERSLSVFEQRAERSIQHLLNSSPPWPVKVHYDLANFVALQYARGWRFRAELNELGTLAMRRELLSHPRVLEEEARRFLRSCGMAPTRTAVAQLINSTYGPDGPRLVLGKAHAIQASLGFALQTLSPMLWTRPLCLRHLAEDAPLLISDNPVVTWAPGHADERVVALADAATITLPLGPHLALSFCSRGNDTISQAGTTRARQINTAVADGADRWIYHHPETTPLQGLHLPAEKPLWRDEHVASRVDDEGNCRELWQTVRR